ncbi:hypothetical protein HK102_011731 [Quaeritorhiza haematococci]|nr:hypothetical protein HK102_011731 [Quaeritorhiza haematococci]
MADRYPGWTEGSNAAERFESPQKEEIETFEALYPVLKTKENRRMYLNFGHDNFMGCKWCKEENDYALYSMPSVVFAYVATFVVLGVATISWRKEHWRLYGVIVVSVIACVDAYMLTLSEDRFKVEDEAKVEAVFNSTHRIRHIAFALLAIVVWFFDRSDEWTEIDILKDVIQKGQVMYNRSQAYRLAKAAALSETELRRKFMEYYKQKEAVNEAITRDLAYQEARQKALRSYNLDKLMSDAGAFSQSVMDAAVREGHLAGVEAPPADASAAPTNGTAVPNGTTTAPAPSAPSAPAATATANGNGKTPDVAVERKVPAAAVSPSTASRVKQRKKGGK